MAGPISTQPPRRWWKEASVYQIYPSSFNDSNGDGIGDIPGIIEKLDYLNDLGIDVVWLSPIYKSPGKDMGYDIEDYRAINPVYGTMEDVENLIKGLHVRGIKLVMDLVVNHTSDQHEWFKESRASRSNPKRKWYVWKDPKYDTDGTRQPPNNWLSVFGGSAWTYDEATSQYYLHIFHSSQPDLDWNHDPVREAVHSLMKFWLDKKIDGFRMDVISLISKAPDFPDAPITLPSEKWQPADQLFSNGPRLHEFLRELRTEALAPYDVMTVGEMPWCHDRDEALRAVGADRGELDMIFEFSLRSVCIDFGIDGRFSSPATPWTLGDLRNIVNDWQTFMLDNGGWNSVYLENHDQPRSYRFLNATALDADDELRERAAKMLAVLAATQCGTQYVYQGQELGMVNIPRNWGIEEYKDIETQNRYQKVLEESGEDSETMREFMEQLWSKARDHARTPMQWDSSPHAGFTEPEATPWMRVNDSYKTINAAAQQGKKLSVHGQWKQLLQLRKDWKNVFVYGGFEMLDVDNPAVVSWKRTSESGTVAVVILNLSKEFVSWTAPESERKVIEEGRFVAASGPVKVIAGGRVEVEGYGAAVLLKENC